ncbi:hypothetical protein [Bacillus toyonensis]|uniref:hypothetical protein n=1 Tax=Bacillus toyonensis TaxID=155322 RepID=UPI000BF3DCDC|nr:hypothetical protein [Bacillus toyonensis]PGA78621.1 hypothetical protein COL90_18170 [Bacillus toyonensis]
MKKNEKVKFDFPNAKRANGWTEFSIPAGESVHEHLIFLSSTPKDELPVYLKIHVAAQANTGIKFTVVHPHSTQVLTMESFLIGTAVALYFEDVKELYVSADGLLEGAYVVEV